MSTAPNVSHGRGGAANIRPDDAPYGDAGIVREGVVGSQGDGAYSTGRGGAANIEALNEPHHKGPQHDHDVIPELSVREAPENYHVGRGGEGNAHHKGQVHPEGEKASEEGLAEKLRKKLFHKDHKDANKPS